MTDDINSIMKEVEEIEKEFISSVKVSQEKIKKVLEKLSSSIKNNAKEITKNLVNEKKIMDTVASFVGKVEQVSEVVKAVREIASNYLKAKKVPEEEAKKWLSKLEKENFANSKEVAQYFQKMVSEINQKVDADASKIQNGDKNISIILIIIGLISVLVIGGLVILKKRLNKKFKK